MVHTLCNCKKYWVLKVLNTTKLNAGILLQLRNLGTLSLTLLPKVSLQKKECIEFMWWWCGGWFLVITKSQLNYNFCCLVVGVLVVVWLWQKQRHLEFNKFWRRGSILVQNFYLFLLCTTLVFKKNSFYKNHEAKNLKN